ncbi:MAG: hypothetical protein DSZ05_09205 [Sulfurospirillum sp.]|nr:MAG: hypothetical protein DSZ05_09205 [Sulfurospirillum sp.]
MRSENYVAFFTVSGFFIGLIFSAIKFDAIENIIFYTISITLFFYLFIHVILIFYLRETEKEITFFQKDDFEAVCNLQIADIKKRERKISSMLKSIHGDDLPKEGV